MIPFNKPFLTGNETAYIEDAVQSGKISGNGKYTQLCQDFFEEKYGFKKALLTTSCTDALEMAALLVNIQSGDEVIMPAFTFVSTANAFVLRGAKIVFADSNASNPNLDPNELEKLVTDKTRAIVVVHYGGIACKMDEIMEIAEKHNLFVIEDAAQAIDSFYKGKPLGSIGHLGTFSFHETKNIISGEGGMLVINDDRFVERAEIIWEKGTNRAAFWRGEVDKYGWVDIGSSYLPSEVIAAFLYAQLENLDDIQKKRKEIWNRYYENLKELSDVIQLPEVPDFATRNGHVFYIVLPNAELRQELIAHLRKNDVHAVFHYLGLHESPYFFSKHDNRVLPNCDRYTNGLLRLPLFFDLTLEQVESITELVLEFCKKDITKQNYHEK